MLKKINLGCKKFIKIDGTSITSNLKELCPICGTDCYGGCESIINKEVEAPEDLDTRFSYNTGINALEAIILAHAINSIDVESKEYVDGIRTALDALHNNIYM
jgi:hypothetical protein